MVTKNKKKKKVSKESLGGTGGPGSSSGNPKTKKKKSKKKTSKEEFLEPILADPSSRSELNLLAALENPIGNNGNVSDDSTMQQEEVEKPNKVIYRAQSFTSLKADLRQDMNRVSSFSRCLNGTFPCRSCSVKTFGH